MEARFILLYLYCEKFATSGVAPFGVAPDTLHSWYKLNAFLVNKVLLALLTKKVCY
ncbi:hypothetical protein [Bacillus cereus]|uniref:hypothetical protein n=1 Tax=Bacillus cereus TaxID=1396 RepID=UPI0014830EEA|nr:hypothetical protein [Bacillus cereus]